MPKPKRFTNNTFPPPLRCDCFKSPLCNSSEQQNLSSVETIFKRAPNPTDSQCIQQGPCLTGLHTRPSSKDTFFLIRIFLGWFTNERIGSSACVASDCEN